MEHSLNGAQENQKAADIVKNSRKQLFLLEILHCALPFASWTNFLNLKSKAQ